METSERDGSGVVRQLRHEDRLSAPARSILIAMGMLAAIVSTRELARYIWPLDAAGISYVLALAAVWAFALFFLYAGLFGLATSWCVAPGRIELEMRSPLRKRCLRYVSSDVLGFSLREINWDGTNSTWSVVVTTRDGQSHETLDFTSRAEARELKKEIEELFFDQAS